MSLVSTPRLFVRCSSLTSVALAGAFVAQSAQASFTTYTSFDAWLFDWTNGNSNSVETETFNSIADGFYQSPFNGSTASVNWSASAVSGLYVENGVFSTNAPEKLSFEFNIGVRAFGGNFFGTDTIFNNATVLLEVKLADGTQYVGTATSETDFTGFISTGDATISSVTIEVFNKFELVFPSADNLYFGVPAPGAVALLCVAGLSGGRRRRA